MDRVPRSSDFDGVIGSSNGVRIYSPCVALQLAANSWIIVYPGIGNARGNAGDSYDIWSRTCSKSKTDCAIASGSPRNCISRSCLISTILTCDDYTCIDNSASAWVNNRLTSEHVSSEESTFDCATTEVAAKTAESTATPNDLKLTNIVVNWKFERIEREKGKFEITWTGGWEIGDAKI